MADLIDREAVRDALYDADAITMKGVTIINNFPTVDAVDADKAMRFLEGYSFKDDKKLYTNGTVLVPLFRVKQAIVDKAYNGYREG